VIVEYYNEKRGGKPTRYRITAWGRKKQKERRHTETLSRTAFEGVRIKREWIRCTERPFGMKKTPACPEIGA